jgi:hypothetical protein
MCASGIIGEEIEKQAALASAALQEISGVGSGTGLRQLLPRAVLSMLGPYSLALYIAEHVVESEVFNVERVQLVHSKLLPFERMADDMLAACKQRGYFDEPDAAEPLHWLETCNEQVKDCMVALESMLDSRLDDLMTGTLEEHQRGEPIPLDSIR